MKVNISDNRGSKLLRFTVDGHRLSIGTASASDRTIKQVAALIESDVASDSFDPTLCRYKLRLSGKGLLPREETQERPQVKTLLEGWDMWVESLNLPERTRENHYHFNRRMIEKHSVRGLSCSQWLQDQQSNLSAFTYNLRLKQLKSCLDWLIQEGLYTGINPYTRVKSKSSKGEKSRVNPFTPDEVKAIIDAIESDRFKPAKSAFSHSHYGLFVRFLFATGCRIGEAVGLTWEQVDLENSRVLVGSSLSKHRGTRVRTSGKAGESAWLPLPDYLRVKLLSLTQNKNVDGGLVFTGPKGKGYLNPDNFRQRVWKPVLAGLGIPYRYPYQSRHTVLSAIAKTGDLPLAARVGRHKNLSMVVKHYGKHAGEVSIPDLTN